MGRKSRGAKDEGVTVWEALERLAPKKLCERYKELAHHLKYQIIVLGQDVKPDPIYDEGFQLEVQLSEMLTKRLETGELGASGIKYPIRNIRNPRQDIAPDLWPFLRLDLINSEAEGQGLKLVALRITGLTCPTPPRSASEPRHDIGSSTGEQGPTGRPRRSGPRTIMPLVEAEMVARAERGELLATLAAESRFLERWAKERHPGFDRPPKAKSIGEALRSIYNDMKKGREPGN